MTILGPIILIAILLLVVFTLANWAVLVAPIPLSLLVLHVNGPLGLILLGTTLVLSGLFSLYVLSLRASMMLESHRHKQEMQAQRKLAESAEASRLSELRAQMEHEFTQLRAQLHDAVEQTSGRLDNVEDAIRTTVVETTNGLAANMGEIENKLDRMRL
jgi:uncharacterized integral membrane protein